MKKDNKDFFYCCKCHVTAPKGKFVFVLKWAAVELNY